MTSAHTESEHPAALRLSIAGLLVDLEFGSGQEELGAQVARLWSHARVPLDGSDADLRRTFLSAPDERYPAGRVLQPGPSAAYTLSGDVTRALITRLIGSRILLHAGVVDHPRLGTLVLVGPSGAGKSTATAHLARAGTYLSDELAIIDPASFTITAYPKPISQVDLSAPGRAKQDLELGPLGIVPGRTAAGADALVLLDRRTEAETQEEPDTLEREPLHLALPRLIEQSSSLWAVPGGLARLADLLTRTGGALCARYREAGDLEELLAHPPEPLQEAWDEVPAAEAPAPGPAEFGIAPFEQALRLESGVLVLAHRRVTFAPGLLGLIWDLLHGSGSLSVDRLADRVTGVIGPHPDSTVLVETAAVELAREGWLVRG